MTFDAAVRDVIRVARDPGASADELAVAATTLANKARNNLGELDEAIVRLAVAMPEATGDAKAMLVAIVAGALVENSGEVGPLVAPVVDRLLELVPRAHRFWRRCADDVSAPIEDDDHEEQFAAAVGRHAAAMLPEAEAFSTIDKTWQPAVLVLTRSREARARCRDLVPALADLAHYTDGGEWLRRLAAVLDDEPYVAIEPSTGVGIAGRMRGITVNFQLSMLLMGIFPQRKALGLIPRKPRVSHHVLAIVRGHGPPESNIHVVGTWNLYTWRAARRPTLDPAGQDSTDWIWNEGMPADIPTLDGHRVILLGPPTYKRGWLAQREFTNLEADLTVESMLSPAEVSRWLEQMRSAPD